MNPVGIAIAFIAAIAFLLMGLMVVSQYLNNRHMDSYTVHVYRVNGKHTTSRWRDPVLAKKFADRMFNEAEVYKVKVWKGTPVRNVDAHPNLIYHLV